MVARRTGILEVGGEKKPRKRPVYYPDSDGKPMAETPLHAEELTRARANLFDYFGTGPDAYVWGNQMMYYVEGEPRFCVSPDVFIAKGVQQLPMRDIWKTWEEGTPTLVIEVTSKKTRRTDQHKKWSLYAEMGVQEYLLYDPRAEYLHPPLQGYRLQSGLYVPMQRDADGGLMSEEFPLTFILEAGLLQIYDRTTRQRLLSPDERLVVAKREQQRAEAERAQAEAERAQAQSALQAAQDRIAELERRLAQQD